MNNIKNFCKEMWSETDPYPDNPKAWNTFMSLFRLTGSVRELSSEVGYDVVKNLKT